MTAKHTPAKPLRGEMAKESLPHVQPRRRGGGEMDVESFVAPQPSFHLGMLVGGVVVHHQMDLFVMGGLALDQTQELQPLFMGVFRQASSDHAAVE